MISNEFGQIEVRDSRGERWTISASIFENEYTVADYFVEGNVVNRTQLIEIILNAVNTAMTVKFLKKLDEKCFAETALNLAFQVACDEITSATFKKKLKAAMKGEEPRTMLGYHEGSLDEHGRLRFIDMEPNGGFRLIDLRTVEYAIVNGVEYMVE